MEFSIQLQDGKYSADLKQPRSIAIPLDFYGSQPNHFEVPKAKSSPLVAGRFCGDTRKGGTCNVETITFTPHCNGTHTETVGHIVNQKPAVYSSLNSSFFSCRVITVVASPAGRCEETYLPDFEAGDEIITRKSLEKALENHTPPEAIAIRTKPNPTTKKFRQYNQDDQPAFFSCQAIQYLVERNVQHLLTDLPSLDRLYDDGMMSNHRLYWGIPAGSKEMADDTDPSRTVTEMIYIDEEISDGLYLLNLQIPAMKAEAVPSNPVLFPLSKDTP